LPGGIAMTVKYKPGHYFKRMTTIERMSGHAGHHLSLVTTSDGMERT